MSTLETKKSSKVGMNMKPRGVKAPAVAGPAGVSTDAVQPQGSEDLATEALEAVSSGVTSEVETAEGDQESATVAKVPESDGFADFALLDENESKSTLADLLQASREFQMPTRKVEPVEVVDGALVKPTTQEEMDAILANMYPFHAPVLASPAAMIPTTHDLGPQVDGTHKVALTIREGYWEGIAQAAEADRVSPEEWVSERFGEYLEAWFFGRA